MGEGAFSARARSSTGDGESGGDKTSSPYAWFVECSVTSSRPHSDRNNPALLGSDLLRACEDVQHGERTDVLR